jgi:hypothetical protein
MLEKKTRRWTVTQYYAQQNDTLLHLRYPILHYLVNQSSVFRSLIGSSSGTKYWTIFKTDFGYTGY